MKNILSILLFFFLCLFSRAQTYKVQWGDEMKVKKGSMDMDIVHADQTGVYMVEGRLKMKSYFVIGYSYGEDFKLYKFDPNYNIIYDKEYKKETKGLGFNSIQPLGDQLYLFAYDYKKKDKQYIIYGAKIDNATGNLVGDMQELCTFDLESKKDDLDFVIKPSEDSTLWTVVGDVTDDVSSRISVFVLDKNFSKKTSAIINMGFAPGSFDLESVTYTASNKMLVLGKEYEVTETGKKKRRTRTFKKYSLTSYSNTGKKEKDIMLDAGEKYMIGGRLIPQKSGETYLTGFYCNTKARNVINGIFIYKIDVGSGIVTQSAFQTVTADMMSKPIDDDNDKPDEKEDPKAKANEEADDEGFSASFIIRNIIQRPGSTGMLMVAEVYNFTQATYTTSSYNSMRKQWEYRTRTSFIFTSGDLLVINTDLGSNKINQVTIIPKNQVESISDYSGARNAPNTSTTVGTVAFFAKGGGMPFYSSTTPMLVKDKLIFLINDHTDNSAVKKPGDKVKTIKNFKKSTAYAIAMDINTGEITRKALLTNEDDPVLMPRFGFVSGNDIYMPAMRMKKIGKTEIKMGKISVK